MIDYYGYIDESGSYGFDFKNHNTHLVVTIILVEKGDNTINLKNEFDQIRTEIFHGTEIKSSKIKDSTRIRILNRIKELDFKYFSLIIDKREIYDDSGIREWKKSFYKFLFRQFYQKLINTFPSISISADELIDKEFLESFKDYLNRETQNTLFQQITFSKSENQSLIQLADIIAGTINRNISRKSRVDVYYELEKQNVGFIKWPVKKISYYTKYFDDGQYSKQIRDLSLHRIDRYIEKFNKSNDPDTIIKVRFVEYLKEVLLYRGPDVSVHRSEIIPYISNGFEDKVNDNYFKSRIVAALRDEDIIIASNRSGYKIPTCKKDIVDFFEMFFANIDPMIKRIKSCYDSIILATDKNLDLLEDEKFQYLKKIITDN